MQTAQQIVLLLHLIGFAALLGGVLVQLRDRQPEVNGLMLSGAWIELLTGAALFALAEVAPDPAPRGWLVVKSVLTVFVLVLVVANRKYAFIPRGLWVLIGGLSLVNAGIGVFGR